MKNKTRVFLDTNIFQDVLGRRVGAMSSLGLIDLVQNKKVYGYYSAITIPILYYLSRKLNNRRMLITYLVEGFSIVDLTKDMIEKVLFNPVLEDLEDGLQHLAAKQSKANYLITRNARDFSIKDIKVVTPEEFLATLRQPILFL